MPNIKSAKKRVKVTARRRAENRWVKAGIKSRSKKLQAAHTAGEAAAINEETRLFSSAVDKAVSKGVFHKNKANRLKAHAARDAAVATGSK